MPSKTPSPSSRRSQTVTLQSVADRCNLSGAAVSMALRGNPRISEKTRKRVRKIADQLGYDVTANQFARQMGLKRVGRAIPSRTVGIIISPSTGESAYFDRQLRGAWQTLARHGFLSLLCPSNELWEIPDPEERQLWTDQIATKELDGVLVLTAPSALDHLAELRLRAGFGRRRAVTLIHQSPDTSSVVTDDRQGAAAAMEHLLAMGHRHIAVLSIPQGDLDHPHVAHQSRRDSVKETLDRHGLPWREHLRLWYVPREWARPDHARERLSQFDSPDPGVAPLIQFLRDHPHVTALIADNDPIAIHACLALHQAGIHVPGQVSVVGFDDTDPLPGLYGRNTLSTIALPLEKVGQEAAELLLREITDQDRPSEAITLPTQFIARGTTGPVRPDRAGA